MKSVISYLFLFCVLFMCACTSNDVTSSNEGAIEEESAMYYELSKDFMKKIMESSKMSHDILENHIRTKATSSNSIEGYLKELDSVDSLRMDKLVREQDILAQEYLKEMGYSDKELCDLIGDDSSTGSPLICAIAVSAFVHDNYNLNVSTRSSNKYLECLAAALGVDLVSTSGTLIKSGVKAAAKKFAKLALTAASSTLGAVATAVIYTGCVTGAF